MPGEPSKCKPTASVTPRPRPHTVPPNPTTTTGPNQTTPVTLPQTSQPNQAPTTTVAAHPPTTSSAMIPRPRVQLRHITRFDSLSIYVDHLHRTTSNSPSSPAVLITGDRNRMVVHVTHRTPSMLHTLHGFGAALTALNLRMFDPHFQLYPGIPVGSSASSVVTTTAPRTATTTASSPPSHTTNSAPVRPATVTTSSSAPTVTTNVVRPQLRDNPSVQPHPRQEFNTRVPRDDRRRVTLRRNPDYVAPHPYHTRYRSQALANPRALLPDLPTVTFPNDDFTPTTTTS